MYYKSQFLSMSSACILLLGGCASSPDTIHAYSAGMPSPAKAIMRPTPIEREQYEHIEDNAIKQASQHPVSTFSIDVDTGSYIALPD